MAGLKAIRVIMEKPEYNYTTSVNGSVPFAEIRQYFVGQTLNLGSVDDLLVKCVDVEEIKEEVPSQ